MVKRRRSIHHLTICWVVVFIGLLIVIQMDFTQAVPKPVPDTKGKEFLFSLPLCHEEFHPLMFIVPQTTEAVNVTLVLADKKTHYIPPGGTLRQELPCEGFEWNRVTSGGIFVFTTKEVMLYIEYEDDHHIVFPFETLGDTYIVTSYVTSEILETFVVISGNNTRVQIHLPDSLSSTVYFNGLQYKSGSKFNISLHEYQTVGLTCLCDLSGAIITSTLPVSVIAGSLNNETLKAFMEQLPPTNVWGKKFIFPGHAWIDKNVTLKITGRDMNTAISITLKDSSISASFDSIPSIAMQLLIDDFLAVETNVSVMCAILYQLVDSSGQRHLSFRILTPLLLYHVSSTFSINVANSEISANLILTSHSFRHILVNKTQEVNVFGRPMTYFWNFYICKAVVIESPFTIRTRDQNIIPFYTNVLRRDNSSIYDYSLGMRVTNIYDACVKIRRDHGGNGDGIDNDCDNKIDEEGLNNRDDDNDKLVDEDISYNGPIKPNPSDLAWAYYQKHKEVETGISTSVLSVIFSILAALFAVGCFIGGMLLADKIRQRFGSSRVTPMLMDS